ncbi:MAG: acyl-CoA synthetase FdrA [Oscillospiraceae bacterium]|nr:acyl-CoA synthetase FdrA [Oscillospiraceae bacterium]
MDKLGVLVQSNAYRDSVFLMKISSALSRMTGVAMASAMMGTQRNKELFEKSGLSDSTVADAAPDDLIIAVRADNDENVQAALAEAQRQLSDDASKQETQQEGVKQPERLSQALAQDPQANVLLLSVAGDYAKYEAAKALTAGLNVMLYSDNISVEDELALKKIAHEKGLLVFGPDCGTTILNGTPLAFANVVRSGSIGIVGASGTGVQECCVQIDRNGAGVSQAIGTGGRDIKASIGGITMMDALELLNEDNTTKVILIVSKPPCKEVEQRIADFIRRTKKPVVVNFAGEVDYSLITEAGGTGCDSIYEASLEAVEKSGAHIERAELFSGIDKQRLDEEIETAAAEGRRYLRGIFSGGGLCYEAMFHFGKACEQEVCSNTPLPGVKPLADAQRSEKNSFVDMGEDEFTVGKPHPMIDATEKAARIARECSDPSVGLILTDCVLGYGSAEDPAGSLHISPGSTCVKIAYVCGTQADPQTLSAQAKELERMGFHVTSSNVQAARLAVYAVNKLAEKREQK